MSKMISSEADRRGKTVSSLITEAAMKCIDLRHLGVEPDDLEDLMAYFELMSAARSVPIPFRLLDHMLDLSVSASREKTLELFYETGKMLGSIVKNLASDMNTLSLLSEKVRKWLPVDDLRIWKAEGYWEIIISGAGYGKSASESLAEGIRGFIDEYGMKFQSIEVLEGFVKAVVA